MLLTACLATVAVGIVGSLIVNEFLSTSLEPLSEVLIKVDDELTLSGAEPLRDEVREAHLYLLQAELARKALTRVAPLSLSIVLAILLLSLALVSVWISKRLSTPVEKLTEGILHYANGDLGFRIEADRQRDELDWLMLQFNRMGGELESQRERLRVSEELAAWQEVARNLAHELKNPLTAMRMAVARAARTLDKLDLEEAHAAGLHEPLELLDQQIGTLHRMTKGFSEFAKLPAPAPAQLDLTELTSQCCALYREASPVEIQFDSPTSVHFIGDKDQLSRAISNLVKNAMEASNQDSGPIVVSLQSESSGIRLEIADEGQGIEAEREGAELTRSLGSSKEGGSGLGLPITYKILHAHGGNLRLVPRKSGGCRAVIDLPAMSIESAASETTTS